MAYRPLGAKELDEICTNCGWPLPHDLNMNGEGRSHFIHPEYGQIYIYLLMKESLSNGRYEDDFILRIWTSVDDGMIQRLIPNIWDHLKAISPTEIHWGSVSGAVGGGVQLWTKMKRTDVEVAKYRLSELYRLRKHLEDTVAATSAFAVQMLLKLPAPESETV